MKRVESLSILLLALLPQSLFSSGISLAVNLDIEASGVFYSQIVPGVSLMYQPESFGVGAEVDFPVDYVRGDTYLIGLVFGRTGWLQFGLGASVMIVPPASSPYSSPPDVSPVIRVGLAIPVVKAGPGAIGFDLFVELFVTALPGSGWLGLLQGANSLKAGMGLSYFFPF